MFIKKHPIIATAILVTVANVAVDAICLVFGKKKRK
jgi:hypothetical protein